MSEKRRPAIIYTRKTDLPNSNGKKQVKTCRKLELYPATQFAMNWSPGDKRWSPKPPLKSSDRKVFWEKYYRVMVNGRWYCNDTDYTLFTESQALGLLHVF